MSKINDNTRGDLRTALEEQFSRERNQLLPALHFVQHQFGYLPDWTMEILARYLRIPESEVYGAVTSYSEFRLSAKSSDNLTICTGLSCWVKGGGDIFSSLQKHIDVDQKQSSKLSNISIEETACGFLCGVAPVVRFNRQWYGRCTVESVRELLVEDIEE